MNPGSGTLAGLRTRRRPAGVGTAAFVLLLLAVPVSAQEWFDDYARGLDALRQRQAPKAIELLERAARKRPDPGTNLITYGTNRLDRYHPYVFLTEAYLMAGNLDGARDALKRSEARGKEPVGERARLLAAIDAAEKARVAAATPPPTTLAAVPPPVATPHPTPAAVSTPVPTPAASVAPPTPAPVATSAPLAQTGTLDLTTTPDGATVLLSGRLLGTTPLKLSLAPGNYQVTLRKEGSADQSFPLRIEAGRVTAEHRPLVTVASRPEPSAAPTAAPAEVVSLLVLSEPPGAAVYLDDEPLGATDPGSGRLVKTGVKPGPHRMRLSRPGHADFVQEIDIASAGPTTVRAMLAPAPPAIWPKAAGAAAGVVVIAAGALVLWRRRASWRERETVALRTGGTPASARPATASRTPSAARRTPAATPASSDSGRTPAYRPTAVSPPTVPEAQNFAGETRALGPKTRVSQSQSDFGSYRLVEQLGRGGMASVFLAERKGEFCALKRPLPAFLEDPEFLERFLREAEIGRTLHHPNIIRILERGEVEGNPYFTMELVKGETLQAHVRRTGALAPKAATRVIAQVAEALDYAHLKGVVHRDLKPSNIMILEDGTVKVMDYGIARARRFDGLTVTGAFLGTPDYVAPETAEGKGTDARSDLYSLGIVFYEILTGKKPFVGDTPFATLRKHCTEPPTPPSAIAPGIPREVELIILRLLAKEPSDRFPGAEELLIELRDFLNRAA